MYNSASQFTLFHSNEVGKGNFVLTFTTQEQVYHVIEPVNKEASKFLLVYFVVHYLQQTRTRMNHIRYLNQTLVAGFQHFNSRNKPVLL